MSLFQCDGCGCVENTALTFGYCGWTAKDGWQADERTKRGLTVGGKYCSACFNGKWHGQFPREFYMKGRLFTDRYGNIGPKDHEQFRLPGELAK